MGEYDYAVEDRNGELWVTGTNIPVRVLYVGRRSGMLPSELMNDHPLTDAKLLFAAIMYADDHAAEMEQQIADYGET